MSNNKGLSSTEELLGGVAIAAVVGYGVITFLISLASAVLDWLGEVSLALSKHASVFSTFLIGSAKFIIVTAIVVGILAIVVYLTYKLLKLLAQALDIREALRTDMIDNIAEEIIPIRTTLFSEVSRIRERVDEFERLLKPPTPVSALPATSKIEAASGMLTPTPAHDAEVIDTHEDAADVSNPF